LEAEKVIDPVPLPDRLLNGHRNSVVGLADVQPNPLSWCLLFLDDWDVFTSERERQLVLTLCIVYYYERASSRERRLGLTFCIKFIFFD